MKIGFKFGILLAVFIGQSITAAAQTDSQAIQPRSAEVEGIKLHYLTARHGPPTAKRLNDEKIEL